MKSYDCSISPVTCTDQWTRLNSYIASHVFLLGKDDIVSIKPLAKFDDEVIKDSLIGCHPTASDDERM